MMASRKQGRFAEFQEALQQFRDLKGEEGVAARVGVTQQLFKTLSADRPDQLRDFGRDLWNAMQEHNKADTLEKAYTEGRAVYRSWNDAGAVDRANTDPKLSEKAVARVGDEPGAPRIGFDALNVLLDADTFRKYKDDYKAGKTPTGPTIELPTTIIDPNAKRKVVVFSEDNGTTTALQPEDHYAAFFAFNEVAKNLARERKAGRKPMGWQDIDKLTKEAKMMRATITRPVLFDSKDIGSEGYAFADPTNADAPPHVRKLNGEYRLGLNATFDDKINNRLRANAIFYQSFYKAESQQEHRHEWSEMVVKFRETGHTAPLERDMEHMAEVVPELGKRPPLRIKTHAPKPPNRSGAKIFDPIEK